MTPSLQNLDNAIERALQDYLKTPVADRTKFQYDGLRDQLAHAAMDYATEKIKERLNERRRMQRGVG